MQRARRLPVSALNPHFTCVLCEGYIIDATTITECVHSFCRTCIVRYLEHNKYCPVCDAQVHETKPLQGIRFDQTLQDIVYKLIPGLYQNEMQRRREFYAGHPEAAALCTSEERGEGAEQKFFYSPDETISLTLEYHNGSKDASKEEPAPAAAPDEKNAMTRYLNCPAALAVSQLKKFISMKFSLPHTYQVEIMYADHVLRDDDTLMDIAYIYAWKRAGPMKFHYNIAKRIPRRWDMLVPKLSKPVVNAATELTQTVSGVRPACDEIRDKGGDNQENELDKMEVDETPAIETPCSSESEKFPSTKEEPVTNCNHLANDQSSTGKDQNMDISEPVNVVSVSSAHSSSKPSLSSTNGPLAYGTVKLVSTSETNTILSTSNGVRLKLIHPPHTNPRGRPRKSKKRCKTAPVQKLARLAPYPPPNTPVPPTCLATPPMSHLPPLAVGKLVPSVMTSLAPALVTTLVSSTANSLCNAPRNTFVPQVANYLNQTNASSATKAAEKTFVPAVLPNGLPENNLQQSSSFAGQNASSLTACQSNASSLPIPHTLIAIPPINSPVNSLPQVSGCVVAKDKNIASSKDEPAPSTHASSKTTASTSDIVPSPNAVKATAPEKIDSVSRKDPPCDNSVTASETTIELNVDVPTSSLNSSHLSSPSSSNLEQKSVSAMQIVSSVDSSNKMQCERTPSNASPKTPTSSSEQTKTAAPVSIQTSSVNTEVKLNGVCNGIQSPPVNSSSVSQSMFSKSFSMDRKASEAYENSVKNSISAEFSDNDDLGCQPDLVVDEQKMDSSDNEDDADTALRKKITAIAEKEDEADATDDTEADSGRASDISSQARSSCDDDMGSPAPLAPTSEVVASSSSSAQPPSLAAPVATTSSVAVAASEESHRPTKSSSLNDVIDNLYRQKKDNVGALDLSFCARKSGEAPSSRPKAVANPVLDIKHRQQTYLPAPNKQHTACPPAPKHPTSSPSLLMQHLGVHHHGLMSAQMAQHGKPPHIQVPLHCNNMAYPNRSSPSSVAGKSTPTYNNSHTAVPPPVPTAHQGMVPFLPSSFLQYSSTLLNSFAKAPMPLPGRSTPKSEQSPPPGFQNKSPGYGGKQQSSPVASRDRKSSDSHSKSPLNRSSPMSATCIQVSHPRASPTLMRMLTQHRSASPAPCPKPTAQPMSSVTCASSSSSSSTSYKSSSSVPMYKKADSYKNYSSKFRGSNLTVFNPDPNGYGQKIVIKNLDRTSHR